MTIAAQPPDDALEGAAVEDLPDALADRAVGRLHNRENPSPAEMAEMLREVQDTLAALDERLEGLEGAQGDSSVVTRRLASSVAEMGETLARRVRLLESGDAAPRAAPAPQPSAPPPPFAAAAPSRPALAGWNKAGRVDTWVLILGLAALAVLVAIGLWVFWRQIAGGGLSTKPVAVAVAPAAPLAPPPAPAPPSTVQAAAPRTTAPPPRHFAYQARRTTVRRAPAASPTAPAASPPPPTAGFRSFGPAATNSVAKPSS
jgi:hypothetical protein